MHSYIDMMKITLKKSVLFSLLALTTILAACKDDRPSVAKIYVRSESNELLSDAMVVLIAKTIDNEAKIEYVDTLMTNASGFAQFNLENIINKRVKISLLLILTLCVKNLINKDLEKLEQEFIQSLLKQ